MSPPVIVLLTVNTHETNAVLDEFVGTSGVEQRTIGNVTYNLLGIHGGLYVVHCISRMGTSGIGASSARTRQACQDWNPKAVIAVGIAFGIDEDKQKIGDVLVSEQIQDYELGKVLENGTITPRGDKPSGSDILSNRFRTIDVNKRRAVNDWPEVRFGLVLSGQKLIDNFDYRESLKALHTEAIGGEMEGAGLYASAQESKVDWLVVKAICDWGHNKSVNKEEYQKLAARNAARVVRCALELPGLFAGDQSNTFTYPQKDPVAPNVDIGRLPAGAEFFVGRLEEIAEIDRITQRDDRGLLQIVGRGGEGKTSLIVHWLNKLANQKWLDFSSVFAWSFYSQGLNNAEVSSDQFFSCIFEHLAYSEKLPNTQYEKGVLLARLVAARKTLVILDGLEPFQNPPGYREGLLKDEGLRAFVKNYSANCGSGMVVLSTRMELVDLKGLQTNFVSKIELRGLGNLTAKQMFLKEGISASFNHMDEVIASLESHALSVRLVSSYVREALGGNLSLWHERSFSEQRGVARNKAFMVIEAYEVWLRGTALQQSGAFHHQLLQFLYLLGFFDRPVSLSLIESITESQQQNLLIPDLANLSASDFRQIVSKLVSLGLATQQLENPNMVNCHPLIRNYFAERIIDFDQNDSKAIHLAAFSELLKSSPIHPTSAQENSSLFQAVRHACLSGNYAQALEVYQQRINWKDGNYVWLELGQTSDVLNCMQMFFSKFPDKPRVVLSPSKQQMVCNQTGCALLSSGRIEEALRAFRKNIILNNGSDRDGHSAAKNLSNFADTAFFRGCPYDLLSAAESSLAALAWTYGEFNGEDVETRASIVGIKINTLLLCSIGLAQEGKFDSSLTMLNETTDWFKEMYVNAESLFVGLNAYWRVAIISANLRGSTKPQKNVIDMASAFCRSNIKGIKKASNNNGLVSGGNFLAQAELMNEVANLFIKKVLNETKLKSMFQIRSIESLMQEISKALSEADEIFGDISSRPFNIASKVQKLRFLRLSRQLGRSHGKLKQDFDETRNQISSLTLHEELLPMSIDSLIESAYLFKLMGEKKCFDEVKEQLAVLRIKIVPPIFDLNFEWPLLGRPNIVRFIDRNSQLPYSQRNNEIAEVLRMSM